MKSSETSNKRFLQGETKAQKEKDKCSCVYFTVALCSKLLKSKHYQQISKEKYVVINIVMPLMCCLKLL